MLNEAPYTRYRFIQIETKITAIKNRGNKKKKKCRGSRCHTADDLLLSRGLQHD
jgi:hypothetical protein